jgi:hypothetical protein
MTIAWHLLQWQLACRLANERSGGQCMYLAGAGMMTAVSPVFLKTYIFFFLPQYIISSVQFDDNRGIGYL